MPSIRAFAIYSHRHRYCSADVRVQYSWFFHSFRIRRVPSSRLLRSMLSPVPRLSDIRTRCTLSQERPVRRSVSYCTCCVIALSDARFQLDGVVCAACCVLRGNVGLVHGCAWHHWQRIWWSLCVQYGSFLSVDERTPLRPDYLTTWTVGLSRTIIIIIIILYVHLNKDRYSAITYKIKCGLPEKQVLIKLAAHYYIYTHC